MTRRVRLSTLVLAALAPAIAGVQFLPVRISAQAAADGPIFSAAGELTRPADVRDWVFVTSGLGMTYNASGTPSASPNFTNVYVNPPAYRAFIETGRWPEGTMFVLEVRGSTTEGSINRGGHFQTGLAAMEASVKDSRFPGKWAYFDFGRGAAMKAAAGPLPQTASCYACHATHAALDNTFVQFYPTLLEAARRAGTLP